MSQTSTLPVAQDRLEQLAIALGLGAVLISVVWWIRDDSVAAPALSGLVAIASLVAWRLAVSGRLVGAAATLVAVLNCATILGVSYFQGPAAHAPAFLFVPVLLSALLLGWKGGTASMGVCVLYVLVEGWFGPAAWAVGSPASNPAQVAIDWALALALSGGLAAVSSHTTAVQIRRARELERQTQRALEEANTANSAKSVFLANMSHELRTPLNAILGYTELLDEDLHTTAHGDDLGRIHTAGTHLLELIDQVLDMSRIESGLVELEASEFVLEELFAEVIQLARASHASAHRLRLGTTQVGRGRADRLRVQQVVTNLISNALKYAPDAPVRIRARRDQGTVEVEVVDGGPGIPAALLPTLFQPFTRGHGTEVAGTGLGLALSYRLAQELGGSLTVESSEEGARFRFRFPFPS